MKIRYSLDIKLGVIPMPILTLLLAFILPDHAFAASKNPVPCQDLGKALSWNNMDDIYENIADGYYFQACTSDFKDLKTDLCKSLSNTTVYNGVSNIPIPAKYETYDGDTFRQLFNQLSPNTYDQIQCCFAEVEDHKVKSVTHNDGASRCLSLSATWAYSWEAVYTRPPETANEYQNRLQELQMFIPNIKDPYEQSHLYGAARFERDADRSLALANLLMAANVPTWNTPPANDIALFKADRGFISKAAQLGATAFHFVNFDSDLSDPDWINHMSIVDSVYSENHDFTTSLWSAVVSYIRSNSAVLSANSIQWSVDHGLSKLDIIQGALSQPLASPVSSFSQLEDILKYPLDGDEILTTSLHQPDSQLLEYVVGHTSTNQGANNLFYSPDCPAPTISALWYLLGKNVPQDVIATMVAREPDLSVINPCATGGTFLATAVIGGTTQTVQTLINFRAPVDQQYYGYDALYFAIKNKMSDNALILIQNSKNVAKTYKDGSNALTVAKQMNLSAVVSALRATGQFPNQ